MIELAHVPFRESHDHMSKRKTTKKGNVETAIRCGEGLGLLCASEYI